MAYLLKLKDAFMVLSDVCFHQSIAKKKDIPRGELIYSDKHIHRIIKFEEVLDWKHIGDADEFISKKGQYIWNLLEPQRGGQQ